MTAGLDIGLMMDCDYLEGQTAHEAFDAALCMAEQAERLGFSCIWLSERHFSPPGGAALVSSVASSPLLIATAIATRTENIRIGTAVLLVPLGHPVRLAEEIATLDQLSQGRLNLGIGRSSFPRSYEGYNIPYAESRDRFQEYLEVMQLAWTQERFSYSGRFYSCTDLDVIPPPYQHPHPPLYYAASTLETFVAIGTMGLPLLVALIGTSAPELAGMITAYQAAWRQAGHPGQGEVRLRLPIYVAETRDRALAEPYASVMPYYERLRQGYLRSLQGYESAERTARAEQLASLTYDEVLQERVAFGTPKEVVDQLGQLQASVGLSGIIMEPNVGGGLSPELVTRSMTLFVDEVAPALETGA